MAYNDHGIEELFGEDLVPRNGTADGEFIFGILLLQLPDLDLGEALVGIRMELFGDILDRKQEGVAGELSSHYDDELHKLDGLSDVHPGEPGAYRFKLGSRKKKERRRRPLVPWLRSDGVEERLQTLLSKLWGGVTGFCTSPSSCT